MDIRIGFLHSQDVIYLKFNGNYSVLDLNGSVSGRALKGDILEIKTGKTAPAHCQWYEKLDSVTGIDGVEPLREKYYLDEVRTRIVKAGRKFGRTDNFEYWILKKCGNMDGKIYPSGDFKYKKLVKKEQDGEIVSVYGTFRKKILFVPESEDSTFSVAGVRVGIDFHWDHTEDLEYRGSLEIMTDISGRLTAVNIISLEDYLASVNSSEMRNDNNIEMLKAQTVAARSTVLATMGKHHFDEGFDLCADDHCQCYQGTGRISELSLKVAKETEGEVLLFDSRVADARYSKICGGITERYSACWEDYDLPYLASFTDSGQSSEIRIKPTEEQVRSYVDDKGFECFCNTYVHSLPESLSFCRDMFRWEERTDLREIEANLSDKFGIDPGEIEDVFVSERGMSGRAVRLTLCTTKGMLEIGKELNIRRLLSKTHLPSSAFYLEKRGEELLVRGAGWGHGAGLCQIGAQIMGESGYGYREILAHYYRGAVIKKLEEL